ncbi:MAG: leucine-rich repeat domain-containing protein [Lachnospiraceae bacterium]|nr:leucine-rich repeat domain-containing protein [Lachnospiraceae bacterium]
MIADRYKYIGVGIVNHECIIVFYPNNLEKSPTFDPNAGYGNLVNGSGAYTGYTPRKIAKSRVDSAYFLLNNTSEDIMMYRNSLHVKNPLKIGDSLTLSFAGVKDWLLPQFIVTSSNPSVLEVNGQTVTAKKSGTATLSVYMSASPDICVSAPVSVQANEEKNNKKNTKVTVDLIYSKAVIDKDSKTAEFAGMNKKYAKNLAGYIMPNTISYNGKSYRVTSIGNNAFKNCKNLKKITIPKDIERIGNNAFRGCSKLQTITVQSTKLTKVGKNAFKGIKKNAKIKVPKKKLAAYKKLMKGKGQKVKVVKK